MFARALNDCTYVHMNTYSYIESIATLRKVNNLSVDTGYGFWYNPYMNKGMNDMTNSTDFSADFDFALELDDLLGRFKMEGMTREDMENIFAEIVAEAFDTED